MPKFSPPSSSSAPVTVSAPGKVLLAGGYLVLERPNEGLVVAASKRFFTTVSPKSTEHQTTTTSLISVYSPQFHSKWVYELDLSSSTTGTTSSLLKPQLSNPSINPFVEKTLRVCMLYLLEPSSETTTATTTTNFALDITIQADNDFYSILPHLPEGQPRTPETVQSLDKFLNCPTDDKGNAIVNKTGLGSSAALTTSLVGALVYAFYDRSQSNNNDDAEEENDLVTIIHNLSQICHCHAQGKVGSGFDVSAACYGTHVYRCFPKCILPDLLGQLDHEEHHGGTNARTAIQALAEPIPWEDDMVTPLNFPQGSLQLLLADVRGGSESPSMAKTVLKWKHVQAASSHTVIPHWDDLKRLNAQAVEYMQKLNTTSILQGEGGDVPDYDALATLPSSEWPETSPLKQLSDTFSQIRYHMKQLGEKAGVPIEPDEQTKLCNATANVPGVVTCLVPGAGGYDAVACLYIDRPSVLKAIGDVWASWTSPIICPLAVQVSNGGLRLETTNNS